MDSVHAEGLYSFLQEFCNEKVATDHFHFTTLKSPSSVLAPLSKYVLLGLSEAVNKDLIDLQRVLIQFFAKREPVLKHLLLHQ